MDQTFCERLIVEVERGDPIAGWVEGETMPRRRFDGLLELIALLERARPTGDRANDGGESTA